MSSKKNVDKKKEKNEDLKKKSKKEKEIKKKRISPSTPTKKFQTNRI